MRWMYLVWSGKTRIPSLPHRQARSHGQQIILNHNYFAKIVHHGIYAHKLTMNIPATLTLLTLIITLFLLIRVQRNQDVILWGAVTCLLLIPVPISGQWQLGVMRVPDVLQGFANEGIATIALLFIVAAGMRDTGALRLILHKIIGRPASIVSAQQRFIWPTACLSAFLNNTPLVAMLLPAIDDWAKSQSISVSKILMPLSFASIMGGACTLMGTSTHLIANGWLMENFPDSALSLFSISPVALPIAVAALVLVIVAGRWLLPERLPPISMQGDARQYTVEMVVEAGGDLVNKTVEQAGLRGLPGLFLVEIDRQGEIIPAVSPSFQLSSNDRLIFAGVVESVVDLQKIRGLGPATDQVYKLNQPRQNRTLIEAVVSDTCPITGLSIRQGKFRTRYNAAVIAVARNGKKINKKIGDIVLQPGDTLLLETRQNFVEQQRNNRDFYLVSKVGNASPPNYAKAPTAIVIMSLMVVLATTGLFSLMQAALLASGLMVLTRCCTPQAARAAVDWQILLVLVAALALGKAMETSGLAPLLGHFVVSAFNFHPLVLLAALFALTAILAACVTAKTGVLLMLPIAAAAAQELSLNLSPFVVCVMLAAATTVATPIGYPTNLMVSGPGGYHFNDYLRLGLPITLLTWVLSVLLIPWFFPFQSG